MIFLNNCAILVNLDNIHHTFLNQIYYRSGSSLLGNLLSLHPSTSYYFEPFYQYEIFDECRHHFNSSNVVDLIEETLGGIFKCEDEIIRNIHQFSIREKSQARECKKTNITVIKTIRIHLNGILPWLHKFPSMKVRITEYNCYIPFFS